MLLSLPHLCPSRTALAWNIVRDSSLMRQEFLSPFTREADQSETGRSAPGSVWSWNLCSFQQHCPVQTNASMQAASSIAGERQRYRVGRYRDRQTDHFSFSATQDVDISSRGTSQILLLPQFYQLVYLFAGVCTSINSYSPVPQLWSRTVWG